MAAAAAASGGASGGASAPRISEETAEAGVVGGAGEFAAAGLAGVGSGAEPLPTGALKLSKGDVACHQ